jgi:phage gpG-like protein
VSGMVLDFDVYGAKQISRRLERLSVLPSDAAPAWQAIIKAMKTDIEEQFDSEGGSMSGGWAPLKPVTIARKAAAGLNTEIMRATDRLKESLVDERGSDQIFDIGPHGFKFGSTVEYGAFHMGPSADGSRPARKPVDFTEAQRRKYVKILQAFLMGGEIDA